MQVNFSLQLLCQILQQSCPCYTKSLLHRAPLACCLLKAGVLLLAIDACDPTHCCLQWHLLAKLAAACCLRTCWPSTAMYGAQKLSGPAARSHSRCSTNACGRQQQHTQVHNL
jgi:hypothetical protein